MAPGDKAVALSADKVTIKGAAEQHCGDLYVAEAVLREDDDDTPTAQVCAKVLQTHLGKLDPDLLALYETVGKEVFRKIRDSLNDDLISYCLLLIGQQRLDSKAIGLYAPNVITNYEFATPSKSPEARTGCAEFDRLMDAYVTKFTFEQLSQLLILFTEIGLFIFVGAFVKRFFTLLAAKTDAERRQLFGINATTDAFVDNTPLEQIATKSSQWAVAKATKPQQQK